jgi:hypothetical protein
MLIHHTLYTMHQVEKRVQLVRQTSTVFRRMASSSHGINYDMPSPRADESESRADESESPAASPRSGITSTADGTLPKESEPKVCV